MMNEYMRAELITDQILSFLAEKEYSSLQTLNYLRSIESGCRIAQRAIVDKLLIPDQTPLADESQEA